MFSTDAENPAFCGNDRDTLTDEVKAIVDAKEVRYEIPA
jgi:hypothetical protein